MSAGQLTCAELAEVQLKAEQIWADNAARKDYIANVDSINALRTEQTATLAPLEDKEKDNTVKIAWIKDCDTTIAACADECVVGGAELEASCDTHTLDICRKAGFTVEEKALRTSMFSKEELIAKGFLRKLKLLDEYLNDQAITVINANVGVNAYTGGKGTVAGFTTTIPAAYWNSSLFSYFVLAMKKNKFADAWLLSGDNLYEAWWNAMMNKSVPDASADAAKFDTFRKYFDVNALDALLTPAKKTFLIDRGALAFASKAYWPTTPVDYMGAGLTKYSIPSKNLPGVMYDVTYTTRCVSDKIYHDFSIQMKAGIFVNPKGCNLNSTGILEFKCS